MITPRHKERVPVRKRGIIGEQANAGSTAAEQLVLELAARGEGHGQDRLTVVRGDGRIGNLGVEQKSEVAEDLDVTHHQLLGAGIDEPEQVATRLAEHRLSQGNDLIDIDHVQLLSHQSAGLGRGAGGRKQREHARGEQDGERPGEASTTFELGCGCHLCYSLVREACLGSRDPSSRPAAAHAAFQPGRTRTWHPPPSTFRAHTVFSGFWAVFARRAARGSRIGQSCPPRAPQAVGTAFPDYTASGIRTWDRGHSGPGTRPEDRWC